MTEQLYFAAGIARRDDGINVSDEIVACADAEAAVRTAQRMWQSSGCIAAVAFKRCNCSGGQNDGAVLRWYGRAMEITITLDPWVD